MATPLYKPPTQVTTAQIPFQGLVAQADPSWARDKFWAVEYTFSGHVYEANPYVRGAYNRLGNVYPVGQAQGQPDPLILQALAPTVGNDVPGLYQLYTGNPTGAVFGTDPVSIGGDGSSLLLGADGVSVLAST